MATLTLLESRDDEELQALIASALDQLDVPADTAPETLSARVDGFLTAHAPTKDDQLVAVALLWGEQLHRAVGWSWACYQESEDTYEYALVAPDRSMWVRPAALVAEQLDAGEDGATMSDVLSAIAEGRVKDEPGTLAELC